MAGLFDFDPQDLSNATDADLGPQYDLPQYGGLLDALKPAPVQAAPVKALVDASPQGFAPAPDLAPTLDKEPGFLERLKTRATTPNDQGFTWGDKLIAVGSSLRGDQQGANAYIDAGRKRQLQTQTLAHQKALSQLFTQSLGPNGRLDPAKWQAGLKALGGDADIGDVSAIQKEFGSHRQILNDARYGGIYSVDPDDPSSFQQVAKGPTAGIKWGGGTIRKIGGGDGLVPVGQAGAPSAGPPAQGGLTEPPQASGAATLPDQVPAAAQGSAQGPPVAGGPTQAGPRGPVAYTPQDLDAMTRALATEALGEGPQGMAAVGNVILNRAHQKYGGAQSIADVVNARHQFEGMSRAGQVTPQAYAQAQAVAKQLLTQGGPDPTNGATQYLNPELQAQLGRAQPAWATGNGQRIGNHVFYGGQGGGTQLAAADATAPPLQGGAGGDQLGGQGQPPPGYEWETPPPDQVWHDIPRDKSAATYGPGAYQVNTATGEIRQVPGSGPKGGGKVPGTVTSKLDDHATGIQVASSINTRLDNAISQLTTGKLKLGPLAGAEAGLRTWSGHADQQTQNYDSFKAMLEKLRNDSLRLNKGTQTEGDAVRAKLEQIQNTNDPNVVLQRLREIQDINNQVIDFNSQSIRQIREDAGLPEIDPAIYRSNTLPNRGEGTPQQQQLAAAKAKAAGGSSAAPARQQWTTGKVYQTPRGPMKRTATGWVSP